MVIRRWRKRCTSPPSCASSPRHRLENPLIHASIQIRKTRQQDQRVTLQPLARFALAYLRNQTANPLASKTEAQKSWLIEQGFQVQACTCADACCLQAMRLRGSGASCEFTSKPPRRHFYRKRLTPQRPSLKQRRSRCSAPCHPFVSGTGDDGT